MQAEAARARRGLRGSPVGTLGKTSDRGHLAHLLTRVRGPRCLCGHPHFLSLLRPVWTNMQQLLVGAPGAKGSAEPWGCGRYSLPQPGSPWDLRPRPLGARFSRHQQSDCGLWPELCSRPRGGAPSRPPEPLPPRLRPPQLTPSRPHRDLLATRGEGRSAVNLAQLLIGPVRHRNLATVAAAFTCHMRHRPRVGHPPPLRRAPGLAGGCSRALVSPRGREGCGWPVVGLGALGT